MNQEKIETLASLLEYKKKARYVMIKLHREIEEKDKEIKMLETVNKLLQLKLEKK